MNHFDVIRNDYTFLSIGGSAAGLVFALHSSRLKPAVFGSLHSLILSIASSLKFLTWTPASALPLACH
ncbi:hypothetical protein M405DRAFT_866150 [Rhizopogon salebrosus TDB-379]|nr:hypothetical protein M405DRAFT_866150 [Rhizopogon salebrosus TDB-379]